MKTRVAVADYHDDYQPFGDELEFRFDVERETSDGWEVESAGILRDGRVFYAPPF